MKKSLVLIVLFLSLTFYGQKKVYFTEDFKELASADGAMFYSTYKDSLKGVQRDTYYMNGVKRNSIYFTNYKKRLIDGVSYEWNSDGNLIKKETWEKGKQQGVSQTYYANGQLKRTETYDNNKFVDGHCYNDEGQEIEFYPYYIKPDFPGGIKEFYKYVAKNFKSPNASKGKIIVGFVVELDGSLKDFNIIQGFNRDMNIEALRVLVHSPSWIPGKIDGKDARVKFTVPITIK
jgi:protein TonB